MIKENSPQKGGHLQVGVDRRDQHPQYSRLPQLGQVTRRPTFARPGALGALVDQALSRILSHEGEAHRLRELAAQHEEQAAVHRRILSSLETLIPTGATYE